MPDNPNPLMPNTVFHAIQVSGELAAMRLVKLLADERFENLAVKDQAKLITLAMARAYGTADGGVSKHMHLHGKLGSEKGVNELTKLAIAARRRLPEFNRPSPTEGVVDAEVLPDEDADDSAV